MQSTGRALLGAAALGVVAVLAACENDIPTATGHDLFPGGVAPTTLVAEFGGSDLIVREETFEGFGNPRNAPFQIVANQFDGALDGHAIARFDSLSRTVSYTVDGMTKTDTVSSVVGGRIFLHVDSLATEPRQDLGLILRELAQPWDSAGVTWDSAGPGTPWTTPGGTPGPILGIANWFPNDTITNDTVSWQLDSATVARISAPGHPGVVVSTEVPGARLQVGGITFAARVRPASKPDTIVELRTTTAVDAFLFSTPTSSNPDVLAAGGLRADRSILTLNLEQEVEACPAGGGACTTMPLSEVTVNRAQLILRPVHVAAGHRPLAVPRVVLRAVSEPELGRFAPLGTLVAADTITPSAFAAGTDREFALDLTNMVLTLQAQRRAALAAGTAPPSSELSFALLADYQNPDLGLLWFERSPVLRVVYTLPLNPTLP